MTLLPRAACLAAVLCSGALATPVSIGDPSFEVNSGAGASNQLGPGGYHYNLGPEWLETNGPGNGNGFEEYITGFAADGTDHLGMQLGHDVWQDLGVTYQPNTRYTLTVATGHRTGSTNPGNQSQYLLADGSGAIHATGVFDASTQPAQTFADAPALVFDTPNSPSAVGQTIRILLQARGAGRSHFDHIRLEATSLVPAGGATVELQAATSVTTTTATLNGGITDIGNAAPAVTAFWGTTNGGIDPGAWQHSADLPGFHSGAFSIAVNGLAAGTPYYFTFRATNGSGSSWPQAAESFETLPLPPVVANLAASGIAATSASAGA
ncbi:hypothetical protein, partial [Luteolibacter marinus]|uniref:hypothetical protein n=1 Tax=Luteolibacter marinus TaxID=2776705 RepID=UPI0018671DC4